MIDLRSDTLTKPTTAMLQAMFNAPVGDDVFEEDPSIKELENKLAGMFGMEAGLFCPSGTMSNQIAIRINTVPQDEVVCHKNSHIYLYEGGGMMSNSHVSVRLLEGERGILNPDDIIQNINAANVHYPKTSLVSIENTMNKGGGSCYTLQRIKEIKNLCNTYQLKLHLDGARIFNAIVEMGYSAKEIGEHFDSISVCLSKGLGAPVGSVLLTSQSLITHAKRVRKSFGGGMRQAGYLAAAGLYALENNIERLHIDHERAKRIGRLLKNLSAIEKVEEVQTNIVIFEPDHRIGNEKYLQILETFGIKGHTFGRYAIRFVFYLNLTDRDIDELESQIVKAHTQL